MSFAHWLQRQLDQSEWDQATLAKRSGITAAQISHLMNEVRGPGLDACLGIAKALGLSPEQVLREAKLLPPLGGDVVTQELIETISLLTEYDKQILLYLARSLARQGATLAEGETVLSS